MTAYEVRWTPYSRAEIDSIWFSTWHGIIPFFEYIEGYMQRQFRHRQYVSGAPIKAAEEQRSSNSHKNVVKNTFVDTLWIGAWGHNYLETQLSVQAIPLSTVSLGYMQCIAFGVIIQYRIPIDFSTLFNFRHVVSHHLPSSWT